MPLPLRSLPTKPLQPLPAPPLEALRNRAVTLRPPALDLSTPLLIEPLLLGPLPLEPVCYGLPSLERDDLTVPRTKPPRLYLPALRTSIGDAVVPCEPHPAGSSAAAQAL